MNNRMNKRDSKIKELGRKRKQVLKVIMIISFIYMLFFLSLILATYYLKVGYSIAKSLQLSIWKVATIGCGMYLAFILLVILLHMDYIKKRREIERSLRPKPVFYKGKRLYSFTYPIGTRGGLYAKTIIDIDDKTAILLRQRIVKPEDIWRDLLP